MAFVQKKEEEGEGGGEEEEEGDCGCAKFCFILQTCYTIEEAAEILQLCCCCVHRSVSSKFRSQIL
jgi:hypothetical protein